LERLGQSAKATDLIGMDVKNLENTKIGKVDELAVDLQSGRVVQIIVSAGGFLGVGDKLVGIPPKSFRLDAPAKALRLDMSKETLKSAPPVELSKWEEQYQSNRVVESYTYYKQEPYFGRPDSQTHRIIVLGRVDRASKVIGENIRNLTDQKIGEVEDLIVDVGAGRVVHAIIASGGFLGLGETFSAVPPSALKQDESRHLLQLDTTKEALTAAPHFKKSDWPHLDDPNYAQQVYRAHHVEPYFGTDVDNSARNVRDRQSKTLTPADQGTSEADMDITRRIRKEITSEDRLSLYGHNVKVITLNGRVTLRGPVQSAEEKRRISDIANRIAKSENVDNQLEIKRDADPNLK